LTPSRWIRRPIRWLSAAAFFALLPKCVVCFAAYAGVGAALGVNFGAPELCGAPRSWLEGSTFWIAISAASAAFGVAIFQRFTKWR
jgi:hypothetical protein